MDYGRRVKDFRMKRNMTQLELAQQTAIPSTSISRIETNDRKMDLGEAVRIAKALGITINDLIEDEDGSKGAGAAQTLSLSALQALSQRYPPETWEAASEIALFLKDITMAQHQLPPSLLRRGISVPAYYFSRPAYQPALVTV